MASCITRFLVQFHGDLLYEDIEFLVCTGMSIREAIASLPLGKYIAVAETDAATEEIWKELDQDFRKWLGVVHVEGRDGLGDN